MKNFSRTIKIGLCAATLVTLAGCAQTFTKSESKSVSETTVSSTTVASKKEETPQWVASYTNMSNQSSIDEVKGLLYTYIDKESVESFLKLVKEYNEIVGETGLQGDFASFTKTEYDVEKISNLWTAKMGDFVGTNCRINTYALLKIALRFLRLKKMIRSFSLIMTPLIKENYIILRIRTP